MDVYGITGFIANVVTLVVTLITTKNKKTVKTIWTNPYGKIFCCSLLYTLLVFIVPWHKIHYGENEKIIIHDTIVIKSPPEKIYVSKDATKRSEFNFKAPVTGNNQFGSGNTQNNYEKPDREVSQEIINEVLKRVKDKNTVVSIAPQSGDRESFSFASKNIKALKELGYKNAFVNGLDGSNPKTDVTYSWMDSNNFYIVVPSK